MVAAANDDGASIIAAHVNALRTRSRARAYHNIFIILIIRIVCVYIHGVCMGAIVVCVAGQCSVRFSALTGAIAQDSIDRDYPPRLYKSIDCIEGIGLNMILSRGRFSYWTFTPGLRENP